MATDYEKINAKFRDEKGFLGRIENILGTEMYPDKTHFIYELIQNAEDANATFISFDLYKDKLEICHNGKLFNEDDIHSICDIGGSTKVKNDEKIGKFGIGFKSVYACTTSPEIHSGDESFMIEHCILPSAVKKRALKNNKHTLFVLPFNKDDIDNDALYEGIGKALKLLGMRTLLFLHNIKKIKYNLPDELAGEYKRTKNKEIENFRKIGISHQAGKDFKRENWLMFDKVIKNTDNGKKSTINVAYKIISKNKKEYIEKINRSNLVVSFPTKEELDIGFLINGQYNTISARSSIAENDPWNNWIIENTAKLICDTLEVLKDLSLLTIEVLEALPIREINFPEESDFSPIFDAVADYLWNKDMLPCDDGKFASAQNVKLARGADLASLLNSSQLKKLYEHSGSLKWLDTKITEDRHPKLRKYLIDFLDIEEVRAQNFIEKLTIPFLETQTDKWFVNFYKFIHDRKVLWNHKNASIYKLPILRLENNVLVEPFEEDGKTPKAFLYSGTQADYPTIKKSISNDEEVMKFLKDIGMNMPSIADDVINNIIPRYENSENNISDEKHFQDIEKVFVALDSDSTSDRARVFTALKDVPFLKAINPHESVTSFKAIDDVYFGNEHLMLYFEGVSDVWFLEEQYENIIGDSYNWNKLNINRLPKKIEHSNWTKDCNLPDGKRAASPKIIQRKDYDLHGLKSFMELLQNTQNFKDKSLALWKILIECLETSHDFFLGKEEWTFHTQEMKEFDSNILKILLSSKWIATKKGTLEKPEDIILDDLSEDFEQSKLLLEALRIGDISNLLSSIGIEHDGISRHDLEIIASHPEEFKKFKESFHVSQNNPQRPKFPARLSANPERRREKMEENINNSEYKRYENRSRTVRVSSGNSDAKTYLKSLYTNDDDVMVCQICKDQMPFKKPDGEYYFEAVEILGNTHVEKEVGEQCLALCPTCAAKYKVFIKPDDNAKEVIKTSILQSDSSAEYEISISLGEQETSIRFVEQHYIDIKEILSND